MPDFIAKPLEPLSSIPELGLGECRCVVREMARELNHLVEQLAQDDVLSALA